MNETAIVTKSTGSFYFLKNKKGEIIEARIREKFKLQNIRSTNPIAVGDKVEYELIDQIARITKIYPRKNYLIRKSVNLSKDTHIIASNIDNACLVFTFKNPVTSLGFIDRFLITCEAYQIQPLILINKMDLYDKKEIEQIEEAISIYTKIGYNCIFVSAKNKFQLEELQHFLKDKTSMFFGHSGSGKSTLVNALHPDLNLKTAIVSGFNDKGQHTTTFAQMFDWPFGGFIIDTPGVKEFGLVEITPEELQNYFPEIFKLKGACKFNNCKHLNEPKCEVLNAVENKQISIFRYESYLKMLEECAVK